MGQNQAKATRSDFTKLLDEIKDEAEDLSNAVHTRYQRSKAVKEKK